LAGLTAYPLHTKDLLIKRALVSVSDKTGLEPLVRALHTAGVEILSTGGTKKTIESFSIPVKDVSDITQFQECLDGRVKTLHPAVHAGLLARMDIDSDRSDMARLHFEAIQLVVVNLYPFAATVANPNVDLSQALENIDIGGPTMIRAAAKNVGHVCVLSNPNQYDRFLEIFRTGQVSYADRLAFSIQAFNSIADYDTAIAGYLMGQSQAEYRPWLQVSQPLHQSLRYGENPHQPAAVYGDQASYIDCFHGKELSYNNFLDVDAAMSLMGEFDASQPTCAIIKHTVACGVGTGKTLFEAYKRAFETDTVSPFGGIVIVNKELDEETASAIDKIFTEIIIAPSYSEEALRILSQKANRRLIRQLKPVSYTAGSLRSIFGGTLVQAPDLDAENPSNWSIVTERQPDAHEMDDLIFAWKIVKHIKSNAIVFVRDGQTLGIGTGQTSRVDSTEIAILKSQKAGLDLRGSAIASDAFFPFADGVEAAAAAGAKVVIQPGGSVRDQEVIEAANRLGMAMIFTGLRHFRH
jgi:phosphoribosylaminoimidazolecarboxamide formyltransferase / IMP cyclohydrolase